MTITIQILTAVALVLSIALPMAAFRAGSPSRARYTRTLSANLIAFFGILTVAGVLTLAGAADVRAAADSTASGLGFIGAALAIGLSGIGSGIGVASSASSALGAISEDGSIFGKSLIFVAMAEGIALYGLIIAFMILGKV